MSVPIKTFLVCTILLTISQSIRGEYEVDSYCTLVGNNVKLASIDNCETYYTCENGKGVKGTCPSNQAFDKNSQNCKPKSDVQCYLNNDKPCQTKSEGFVPVIGTCNGYIYCKNYVEKGRGYCPSNLIFSQEKCIYGNCNENINEGSNGLNSVCEIMPDNKFFGSSKNCLIWQKCDKGALASGNCPKDFVFDVELGKCNYESGNMCSRVTGQDIQPDPTPTRPCTSAEKGNTDPDTAICSGYNVCDGTKWVRHSCNEGFYFSVASNKCESRQYATPIASCSRCQYSKRQFVNGVDADCRDYQICSNGTLKNKGECDDDSYFDEASQACIMDKESKNIYAKKNGACASCNSTCSALSSEKCSPINACQCALDDKKACIQCEQKIVNGTCTDEDDQGSSTNCADTCQNLPAGKCEPQDNCKCGTDKKTEKCIECPTEPDSEGNCADEEEVPAPDPEPEPAPDCTKICSDVKSLDKCQKTDECTCGINDGACTDCSKDTDCNDCKCAGSKCPPGEKCACIVQAKKCTVCPNGIKEDSDPEECNAEE